MNPLSRPEGDSSPERGSFGGRKEVKKMENKKSPCAAGEGQSRDETTVFVEDDPLCAALDEFCATLNCWYAAMNNPWQREDRVYRRQLAKNLRDKLKRAISDEWDKSA